MCLILSLDDVSCNLRREIKVHCIFMGKMEFFSFTKCKIRTHKECQWKSLSHALSEQFCTHCIALEWQNGMITPFMKAASLLTGHIKRSLNKFSVLVFLFWMNLRIKFDILVTWNMTSRQQELSFDVYHGYGGDNSKIFHFSAYLFTFWPLSQKGLPRFFPNLPFQNPEVLGIPKWYDMSLWQDLSPNPEFWSLESSCA